MILGLRTAGYNVPSDRLAEAKEWYTRFAGVPPYFDEPSYVGFNVCGFELGLLPDDKPGPGGSVAFWGTADIVAEAARLEGIGAKVISPVQDVGGDVKVATVADPFGNLIGVIQNPHFNPAAVK